MTRSGPIFTSLRARLMAGLVVVALIGAAGASILKETHRQSASDVLEDVSPASQALALVQNLAFDKTGRFVALRVPERWKRAYATPGAAFFTVFDAAGVPVARSPNLKAPLERQPLGPDQVVSRMALIGAQQDVSLTARAPHGYAVVVGRSLPGALDEETPERIEALQPLLLFVAVLSIGLLAVWLVAGWSLRPLGRASAEAASVGPERLDGRITLDGLPAEIVPLASAVNGALDRVARAYAAERRFTADAAHALRTPVAVMDLRLQRGAATGEIELAALRGDLREIAHLISGLLNLARAEQDQVARQTVNLARLLRETAAAMQPAFEAAHRSLAVEAPEKMTVQADARSLRDLIEALFDNALQHGQGVVTAKLARADGKATLTVQDQGGGVPTALQDRVFERFTKVDPNSPGAGLGLSIVRQTARALGGEARFAAASTIEVTIP